MTPFLYLPHFFHPGNAFSMESSEHFSNEAHGAIMEVNSSNDVSWSRYNENVTTPHFAPKTKIMIKDWVRCICRWRVMRAFE